MSVTGDYGRWKLPQNLEELSNGDSYPRVLREWELDYIEHLAPGEDSETCLCTHFPIREVCHIRNLQNANTAIVGNCCVKKFEKEEEGAVNFEGTHKVFDCLKRLQRDENANANEELLNYAYSKGVLTKPEYDRYLEIWRNRTFTDEESRLILTANRKIINHASSQAMRDLIARQAAEKARRQPAQPQVRTTVPNPVVPNRTFAQIPRPTIEPVQTAVAPRTALPRPDAPSISAVAPRSAMVQLPPQPVTVYPSREPAALQSSDSALTPFAPKKRMDQSFAELQAHRDRAADAQIVQEAYSQKILQEKEYQFYMQMVGLAGKAAISPKQQSWLSALNQRILTQFKLNVPSPYVAAPATPQVKLADRQIVVDAFNNGIIKDKDRDFYLGLIQRRVTSLTEKQKKWVGDIHKRLRFEDDQTEANNNPRPVKRALIMEDPIGK